MKYADGFDFCLITAQKKFHFDFSFETIDTANGCDDIAFAVAAEPDVDAASIAGGSSVEKSIIERVNRIGISRVPRPPWPIDDYF